MKMKKLTAVMMTSAMVVGLAACGGNSNTSTTAAASADTTAAAAADTTAAASADTTAAAAADTTAAAADSADTTAAAAADGADYSSLDPVELVGADSTGKGAAGQIFGEMVAQKVDEITGGQLTIDYHPNGDLGGDADLLRQAQNGDIAIVVCQTAPMVSFVSDLAVFDLPMVFAKYDGATIDKVLNGADSEFHKKLAESYEAAGFHALGFLQNATYRLTTANVELKDLASFAKLQIRTMENSNHMAFWTAIGAEPTPLAWSEVYFALQSGTIDAQENAADTCVGANLNEVQKYLACTNHILYLNQIIINNDKFNSLDPLYQDALTQAVEEAIAELRPALTELDKSSKDTLAAGGMEMVEYAPEFYDEILNLQGVQDLYTKIDGEVDGLGTILQDELAAVAGA